MIFVYRLSWVFERCRAVIKRYFFLSDNCNTDGKRLLGKLDWDKIHFNRISIVVSMVSKFSRPIKYLEIGCFKNDLFDSVPCLYKVGVDPALGGNVRMTSDEFFADNTTVFDLVFIDGLHHYDQCWRDLENSLACLAPDGFVLIHDVLPRNSEEQTVPRVSSHWTGDCWKVLFDVLENEYLDLTVVSVDHGIAIVSFKEAKSLDFNLKRRHGDATFDYFLDNICKVSVIDSSNFFKHQVS